MPGQQPTDAEAISRLKSDAQKLHNEKVTALAASTHYIDVSNVQKLSAADKKLIVDAYRQDQTDSDNAHVTDAQILKFAQQAGKEHGAHNFPGNVIVYDSKKIHAAHADLEFVLAHELGHKAIQQGAIAYQSTRSEEGDADHFGAEVTSPQRAVDSLRSMAIYDPSLNQAEPGDTHGTAYDRAQTIKSDFQGQVGDLKNFPKPGTRNRALLNRTLSAESDAPVKDAAPAAKNNLSAQSSPKPLSQPARFRP